jgi:hypothetical protein
MTPNWKELLASTVEYAKERMIDTGHLVPMAVIYARDPNRIIMMPLVFDDEETQRASWQLLRIACVAHDAIAVTLMVEAWMRMTNRLPGESEEALKRRAVERTGEKIEVISVQMSYRDGDDDEQHDIVMEEILRDAAGRPVRFKTATPQDEKPEQIFGPMQDMLPSERPTPLARSVARDLLARYGETHSMTRH